MVTNKAQETRTEGRAQAHFAPIADTYHGSLPLCTDRRGEKYWNQWNSAAALFHNCKLYTVDANGVKKAVNV